MVTSDDDLVVSASVDQTVAVWSFTVTDDLIQVLCCCIVSPSVCLSVRYRPITGKRKGSQKTQNWCDCSLWQE